MPRSCEIQCLIAQQQMTAYITDKIAQLQALRKLTLHDKRYHRHDSYLSWVPPRGVYLFNNQLSGSIPPSIGSCPLLHALDVSNNSLTGTIPTSLGNSTRIYRLNLSINALLGLIHGGNQLESEVLQSDTGTIGSFATSCSNVTSDESCLQFSVYPAQIEIGSSMQGGVGIMRNGSQVRVFVMR